MIIALKRHKNIFYYYMEKYFKNLLERFYQAKSDAVKSAIYEEMVEYADAYHPDYVCYDMDMYVALYKCAKTSEQRKHVLEHIQDIIVDDSYQYHDEIIGNLKEFTQMKDFLKERDVEKFDSICMDALDFFENQKKKSESESFMVHHSSIPSNSLSNADKELNEVAGVIVGTDMHNLESYQNAWIVLGN